MDRIPDIGPRHLCVGRYTPHIHLHILVQVPAYSFQGAVKQGTRLLPAYTSRQKCIQYSA